MTFLVEVGHAKHDLHIIAMTYTLLQLCPLNILRWNCTTVVKKKLHDLTVQFVLSCRRWRRMALECWSCVRCTN